MPAHIKENVLALVAESRRDYAAASREYVSEGLYDTVMALHSNRDTDAPRLLSSDILGAHRQYIPGISKWHESVRRENFDQAVTGGDVLSLDEMTRRVIDPSWRLSKRGAEELTDFGFLKQAPILNLLNGFEYMMDNVFKSAAANLAALASNHDDDNKKRPMRLVDSGILLRNQSSTTADVAVGRARRVMALFSYTLIDILKWKKAMSERVRDRGLLPFPSVPSQVPYDRLIKLIIDRGTKFTEGLIEISDTSVISVLAAASAENKVFCHMSGTFYESILGYEIMSMLSAVISAEYNALITRAKVPVDLDPTTKEYPITSPATGTSVRQPFFSNFSVMRVRQRDLAARYSMYVMWNTLFLATGGLTIPIAENNSTKSHLLLNFFLKDLHVLFSCTRCEDGFAIKTFDTFSMWEKEKSNAGEGDREMRKVLAAALESLSTEKNDNVTKTIGQLIYDILAYFNPGDDLRTVSLAATGKIRIQKLDSDVRELYETDRQEYANQGSKYISVSKGFTALAFYLIYSSAATAPQLLNNSTSQLDTAVTSLLARWGSDRFPTHNILWRRGSVHDEASSPLLAFAGIWALRNAVRARRYVDDPSNTIFVPGRPLTILEALSSFNNLKAVLKNNYIFPENIDLQNLVWKAIEELETESELWWVSSSDKNVLSEVNFSSKLVKEPAGLIVM